MIRWNYVLPRLLLLGALVVLVWVGLNPLVRWAIVSLGQSAASAKVEIGQVETSLLRTELRLTDVRVANPKAPMENLVEAAQVIWALDGDALLGQRFVVREGRVSGLRFGTGRETSGTLDPAADWSLKLPKIDLPKLDGQCLEPLTAILEKELVEQAEQLESVRLVKELIARWPVEYERLEARTESLKQRIDQLRKLSQNPGNDTVSVLNTFQRAASELESVEREMKQLRRKIERLYEQALVDKDAVDEAKERDLQKIQETLRLATDLNAETLSEYLLGPELNETVLSVAKWVQWGRQYFPAEADSPEPVRSRGVDVVFPSVRPEPDFLIRSLALDGQGQLGHHQFQFSATAAGITTQPQVYGQPVVLKAQVDAGTPLQLEAVLDHTGETPHDRITINLPGIKQPERVLGRPGQLAVTVSPGSTHLWVSLDLEGDALSGQILVAQKPVELTPDLGTVRDGPRLAQSLQTAMREVQEIRVVVDLSGTLQKPDWKLQSNLGPQLAGALNGMLKRELEARRQELLAYVRGQVESELAQFEGVILAKQEELFGKLNLDSAELQQLTQLIARRVRLPNRGLAEGLSDRLPLRF
ncbi:MAG: TIGR03545 family protein [Planctomycetota bacterium]